MKQYSDPLQQEAHDAFFVTGRAVPEEVLPPGLSKQAFLEAMSDLRDVCKPENVVTGSDLVSFVDPFAINSNHIPSAAVCPANISEIQAILAIVNTRNIPIWICSRGKNLGYGGPAPLVKGSIVLSLYRMSSIIEVNESGSYAVVEPGVTFRDLAEYCLAKKPSVWPSVPSIGWGSVLGNTLDRGIGYNILGDHYHHVSGLEVVLANGDVVRTGQWAADGAPTAHLCKNSYGPQIDGLFLQSNLGIVTKMSLWLQPRPESYMSVKVEVDKFSDLEPLMNGLAELHRADILQNNPLIGDVLGYLSIHHSAAELHPGPGAIPDRRIEELRREHHLGYWNAVFDFYGPSDMVLLRLQHAKAALLRHCPNSKIQSQLFEGKDGMPLDSRDIARTTRGEPVGLVGTSRSQMINFATPPDGNGHGAHTDFVPLMPNDGKLIMKWFTESRQIMVKHGFNPILGARIFKKHSFTIQMITYDSSSQTHAENLPRLWKGLAEAGKKYKLTNYRSHLDNMDEVQKVFDFNNHAYRRFVETIKVSFFYPHSATRWLIENLDQLDPNGILSPGKQGIWPKRWRETRA